MSSSGDDSSDYEEMETEVENILCVFCTETLANDRVFADHCKTQHSIDIVEIFGRLGDVFHVIKAINFLRKTRPTPEEFAKIAAPAPAAQVDGGVDGKTSQPPAKHPWDSEDFLEPVVPNDPLLLVDFEHAFAQHHAHHHHHQGNSSTPQDVAILKEQLQLAHERIAAMQKTARSILGGSQQQNGGGDLSPSSAAGASSSSPLDLAVATLKVSDDGDYIDSYSHFGIHEEMLQDTHRTESYRDAIARNAPLFEGRTCLDVGCGTAILSMFLARDGRAAQVIGVDFSEMIYSAMDIVRENGLEQVVQLKKGKLEDVELAPVDVIVSEWMGYFLLFENMLDTVISARDRLLKPGGVLLPNRANLYLTLSDDAELHAKHVRYWDDVYGFKMSCMRKPAIADALVQVCAPDSICGSTALVKHFDLNTVTIADTMNFGASFELVAERDAEVTAIVGFFDTLFDLPSQVVLSTSPRDQPTHWKQTIFLLPEPHKLARNAKLSGTIEVRRNPKNRRGLEVQLEVAGRRLKYTV